jgi:hypothetical protein
MAPRQLSAHSAGLLLLAGGTGVVGATYFATIVLGGAPAWAAPALAFGAGALAVGLFVLGASRGGRLPVALRVVFGAVLVVVVGSFVVALALPSQEGPGGLLLLGLPLRTAIVFYGVGFVPLGILPLAYGLTFRSAVLSDEDLSRLRAAIGRRRGGGDEAALGGERGKSA